MAILKKVVKSNQGRITILAVIVICAAIFFAAFINFSGINFQTVNADDITTSITVLNTPPQWNVDAQEQSESSTASPTNSGSVITWVATGNDPSDSDYYLLICNSTSTPTANASAPPTCGGGQANQWAVSAATTDMTQASAATTTTASFAETNNWYAWICDGDPSLPRCNTTYKTGTGNTASPFIVNHRPTFTAYADDSPVNPGAMVTWTTTASDSDTAGGADTVTLFVCKSNDFTGSACGGGGTWATSTSSASNPTATTTITIPYQDQNYAAYGYVIDNHSHAASGGSQGTDSVLTVSNVAPSVTAATISLVDTDDVGNLELITPAATSGTYKVQFTAVDNNSCQNASTGDEVASAIANVYRSGVTQTGCDTAGEYNANNCYVAASPSFDISCTQDGGTCSGSSDSDSTWTCNFDLWYIAEPTDGTSATDSTWWNQNWLASVQLTDDDSATSTLTEATSGNELVSFMAFDVATTTISYPSLEPGSDSTTLSAVTDLVARGNVGLDENLYGDGMCTTWTAPDSCPVSATSTIPVGQQEFATSSVAYGSGTSLPASTTPAELEINVLKSTSTSTQATANTYWGIAVPGTITMSGSYSGQDTITAIKGEAQQW